MHAPQTNWPRAVELARCNVDRGGRSFSAVPGADGRHVSGLENAQ